MLPPTPPSSSSSSDSEGSSSPVRDEAAGSPNSETGSETESAISPLTSPSRRSNCQQQPAGRVLLTNSPTSNGTSKASTSDPLASAGTTTSIRHPIHSPLISYQPVSHYNHVQHQLSTDVSIPGLKLFARMMRKF